MKTPKKDNKQGKSKMFISKNITPFMDQILMDLHYGILGIVRAKELMDEEVGHLIRETKRKAK